MLIADRNQIEIFVEALFRYASTGHVSLRSFYENRSQPLQIVPYPLNGTGLSGLIDIAEEMAGQSAITPEAVVFCPPIATFRNGRRATESDIVEGLALSVELDAHPHQARAKLEHILGPATLAVRSGGRWTDENGAVHDKMHLHWRLSEPATEERLALLKQARKLATCLAGGDPSNVPIVHPIRWPGSWHRKVEPRLCKIESASPDFEIALELVIDRLEAASPRQEARANGRDCSATNDHRVEWEKAFGEILTGESYHPTLTPLAASMAAWGVPQSATDNVLRGLLINSKPIDSERERRRLIELSKLPDTVASAYKKFGGRGAPAPEEEATAPVDPGPLDVGDFMGSAPERKWIVPDWIAEGVVNSLYGTTGIGKTLLAQQLAYSLAVGGPFLGIPVEPRKSFCVLCEDDRDELHRRHDTIRTGLGYEDSNPFAGKVTVWPRVGLDNLLVIWDHKNEPKLTRQFKAILDHVLALRPDLLILDTLADVYGGNEIVRVQVNHFIKTVLGRLILQAQQAGFTLTVLLLAHPSMAGIASGTGSSGSTGWEAAVRARLYMRHPEAGHSDERELVRVKANYATSGEETTLRMLYQHGFFVTFNVADTAVASAKQHLRGIIDAAWNAKRPFTSKKGHPRFLHTAGLAELLNRGVRKDTALKAIRELIEEGGVFIKKANDMQGYRCQTYDTEAA